MKTKYDLSKTWVYSTDGLLDLIKEIHDELNYFDAQIGSVNDRLNDTNKAIDDINERLDFDSQEARAFCNRTNKRIQKIRWDFGLKEEYPRYYVTRKGEEILKGKPIDDDGRIAFFDINRDRRKEARRKSSNRAQSKYMRNFKGRRTTDTKETQYPEDRRMKQRRYHKNINNYLRRTSREQDGRRKEDTRQSQYPGWVLDD